MQCGRRAVASRWRRNAYGRRASGLAGDWQNQKNFTAIGDVVITAARLQSAAGVP